MKKLILLTFLLTLILGNIISSATRAEWPKELGSFYNFIPTNLDTIIAKAITDVQNDAIIAKTITDVQKNETNSSNLQSKKLNGYEQLDLYFKRLEWISKNMPAGFPNMETKFDLLQHEFKVLGVTKKTAETLLEKLKTLNGENTRPLISKLNSLIAQNFFVDTKKPYFKNLSNVFMQGTRITYDSINLDTLDTLNTLTESLPIKKYYDENKDDLNSLAELVKTLNPNNQAIYIDTTDQNIWEKIAPVTLAEHLSEITNQESNVLTKKLTPSTLIGDIKEKLGFISAKDRVVRRLKKTLIDLQQTVNSTISQTLIDDVMQTAELQQKHKQEQESLNDAHEKNQTSPNQQLEQRQQLEQKQQLEQNQLEQKQLEQRQQLEQQRQQIEADNAARGNKK